jgi:hypothetical protein
MDNKLQDIVLFCKSYKKDFLRLRRLLESIGEFNADNIPFYISTPESERGELFDVMDGVGEFNWISDEEIIAANPTTKNDMYKDIPGQWAQAIIKAEFWRLNFAKNYLCLDSDCIFLNYFYKSDFLYELDIPYTVLHQNKEFFQIALDRNQVKVEQNLNAEAERVKKIFGRVGQTYYCAPAPFIWSSRVWESFDRQYLQPNKLNIWQALTSQYPETLVYGESLLKYGAIPLHPIEPLFRVYHYDWHYYFLKRSGETIEKVKKIYLGVIFQSNWESELSYGVPTKTLISRIFKKIKRFLRFIQSYI